MTHDEIKAELSSFALGALDAADEQAVAQHLAAGCRECEVELASWREVVGLLALDSRSATTPDLKPALLRRVRAGKVRNNVIRLPRWALIPLAAAAAAILVLGIVRNTRLQHEVALREARVGALNNELAAAQTRMQRLTEQLAAQESDAKALRAALAAAEESLAIVRAPGLQLVRLKETPTAQPAEGHVLLSTGAQRAVFYAFDLPDVPPDKAYELWWITEKEGPINAGLFRPDARGIGRVETAVPAAAGAIQAAAVTIEPAAGVPKPTGPMVLIGKL